MKKCYSGNKLLPDLSYKMHVAGMSGKKADKTEVKACAQVVGSKMVIRHNYEGLYHFYKNLYD